MGKLILPCQSTHEGTEIDCLSKVHTPFALPSGLCAAHNAQISSKIWTSRVTCEKVLTVSAVRRRVRSPSFQGSEDAQQWYKLIAGRARSAMLQCTGRNVKRANSCGRLLSLLIRL